MFRRRETWINFYLVDDSSPDLDVKCELPVRLFLARSKTRVRGLKDLVDAVSRECEKSGGAIRNLVIAGSGNGAGAWAGKDWISVTQLPNQKKTLQKLTPYFRGGQSAVTFHGFEDEDNPLLIQQLSRLWDGVAVSASDKNQYPEFLSACGWAGERHHVLKSDTVAFSDQNI